MVFNVVLTKSKRKFMIIDLSLFRYFAEFEIGSVFFVVGGLVTVGIATVYWWYMLNKDRD